MPKEKSLMILVAGPYRSGTHDDPKLIAANVKAMTDAALEIYKLATCLFWENGLLCH
jgi:hypothetical protein